MLNNIFSFKSKTIYKLPFILFIAISLLFIVITHYNLLANNLTNVKLSIAKYIIAFDIILIITLALTIFYIIFNYSNHYIKKENQNNLQKKIIKTILFLAILPPLLCLIFFFLYFSKTSKFWFQNEIDQALKESQEISHFYINESKLNIKNNLSKFEKFVEKNTALLLSNPLKFEQNFSALAATNSITEAVIIIYNKNNGERSILAKTDFSFYPSIENIDFEKDFNPDKFGNSISINDDDNYIKAITKLSNIPNAYILIGDLINDKIVRHINNVNGANKDYTTLKNNIKNAQKELLYSFSAIIFFLIFSIVLAFLNFIYKYIFPIVEIVGATEKISNGNYQIQLDHTDKNQELSMLYKSFNNMVTLISKKNNALSYSKKLSDNQKEFLEYIMGIMPTAVIYLNTQKEIKFFNSKASLLFNKKDLCNIKILENNPELNDLILNSEKEPDMALSKDLIINNIEGIIHTSIAIDSYGGEFRGYIINLIKKL